MAQTLLSLTITAHSGPALTQRAATAPALAPTPHPTLAQNLCNTQFNASFN